MSKIKIFFIFLFIGLLFNLTACSNQESNEDNIKASDGEVSFYGWGGDERVNEYIDGYLSDLIEEKNNIELERVGMDIDEVLNILLNEKQVGVEDGDIDIVWLNGENFFTAKENGLLYGPFAEDLDNFNKYIDKENPDVKYDFGVETEGYEVPFGKAQFVMAYDEDKVTNPPKDHEELLEWTRENPGKFTYPAPPDFTGSAFVRNIIYDIVGYEQFLDMEADYDRVEKEIRPAMDYLIELKPYLWNEGRTYPANLSLLNNMYGDGEVSMTMDYNPNSASAKIESKEFPESTRTFVFENGSIGNTHFLAIPFNSSNKEGAKKVINEIISVNAQAEKYDPSGWGDLPVLENDRLSEEEKKIFDSIEIGQATLKGEELLQNRLSEMPAKLVPIIEEIWMEKISAEGE